MRDAAHQQNNAMLYSDAHDVYSMLASALLKPD
jgi:hypothetical protein